MGFQTIKYTYYYEQTVADTTWTIVHNLNTLAPCVDFWILESGSYTKILPATVIATDANTVVATFSTAQSGRALVV